MHICECVHRCAEACCGALINTYKPNMFAGQGKGLMLMCFNNLRYYTINYTKPNAKCNRKRRVFQKFYISGNKKPHLHRTLLQISAGGTGTAFTEFRRGTFLREDQAFSVASSSGWGKLGGAVGAPYGVNCNGAFAVGTDLCGGGRRSLLLLFMRGFAQRVEGLYNKEHKKRKQYKVEHHGNEFAVVEGGCAGLLSRRKGIVAVAVQRNEPVGEVHAAGNTGDKRHKQIVYEGIDNAFEGTADYNAYGHIHNVALVDELAEFRPKTFLFLLMFIILFEFSFLRYYFVFVLLYHTAFGFSSKEGKS